MMSSVQRPAAMATKRQRMAIVTVTGEPKLSMPQFLATLPPAAAAAAVADTHATRLASDAECYLAYCYLCRTGACVPCCAGWLCAEGGADKCTLLDRSLG